MDLNAWLEKPHLSATAVNDYQECGLRYRLGRIDRKTPECINDSRIFGSAIHRALKVFHRERMYGNFLDVEELVRGFAQSWREEAEDRISIRWSPQADFETLLVYGGLLLEAYHAAHPRDGYRVIAVEEPFHLSVEGIPVPIVGVIDLVEEDSSGTVVVVDFKTTGRSYSSEEVNRSLQLTLYSMAVRGGGFSDREILVRYDCLIKTRKPGFQQYYSIRTAEDEARAVRKIRQVWDGVVKGVFIPNDQSWKCQRCEYRGHCDAWFAERESEAVRAPA